jgi:ribosomal-protein-alanine N-acetyltransferase
MDNIEICNMHISDLDSISNILLSDFDDFWSYSIFKSELENPNSFYIMAKQNNIIIGFAGIWQSVDDIHITNIVVKKPYRNNGVGSMLLNKLIQICKSKKTSSITLEVSIQNVPAIKLYEKYGFKNVGIRKKYYNNLIDAIIMTMEVNK